MNPCTNDMSIRRDNREDGREPEEELRPQPPSIMMTASIALSLSRGTGTTSLPSRPEPTANSSNSLARVQEILTEVLTILDSEDDFDFETDPEEVEATVVTATMPDLSALASSEDGDVMTKFRARQ